MDSGGSGLIVIVLFQRHGLCVVPFVVHASVCGHFSRKDRWCERHTHHARRRKKHGQRRGVRRPVKRCSERFRVAALSVSWTNPSRKCADTRELSKDTRADAQNVACTTGGRRSVLTLLS